MNYTFKFFISFFFIQIVYGQQVIVDTSRGSAIGYHFDQGSNKSALYYGQADIFLGVPFAQPPVGSLRFSKPQRLNKFSSTPWNATYSRPQCPMRWYNSESEDCLYLNVFTPNASSTTKFPVMVWIFGGGLMVDSTPLSVEGTVRNFVSRGVVVVEIHYRVGALGFFTTFTDDFPPNLGMLDQVESLKFVQEEISNFGGDPTKVTIFGESAGAASVSAHAYSPLSRDLFHQGIQESGTVLTCFEDALGPTYKNIGFAKQACNFTVAMWNSGNFNPLKTCLMNMSYTDILKYEYSSWALLNGNVMDGGNSVCWDMVQDNYFFPGVPRTLWQNRTSVKPMIIGTNKDEWAGWVFTDLNEQNGQLSTFTKNYVETQLISRYSNFLGDQASVALELFESLYLDPQTSDDDHMAWLKFMVNIGTSFIFTGPTGRDVEFHLWNNNSNVYLYEFTYYSKDLNGNGEIPGYNPISHGAEVGYVLMNGWQEGKVNASDVKMADFFADSWTNFAKYGKPTLDDTWQPATSTLNNMEYLEIGSNLSMKTGYRVLDQIQFNRVLPIFIGEYPQDLQDYNNGSIIGCPTGWTKSSTNSKRCYNVFNISLSQKAGLDVCLFSLASVISIDNAFENSEIQAYITSNAPNCAQTYIGLIENGTAWSWENGDTSSYRNWATGYPTTDPNSNCTAINSKDGKWLNQACNIPLCYICSFDF